MMNDTAKRDDHSQLPHHRAWHWTTIGITVGVTLWFMHTIFNLERSTRLMNNFDAEEVVDDDEFMNRIADVSLKKVPRATKVQFYQPERTGTHRSDHFRCAVLPFLCFVYMTTRSFPF